MRILRPGLTILLIALLATLVYLWWAKDPASSPTPVHGAESAETADARQVTAAEKPTGDTAATRQKVEAPLAAAGPTFKVRGLAMRQDQVPFVGATVLAYAGTSNERGLDMTNFFAAIEKSTSNPQSAPGIRPALGTVIANAEVQTDGAFQFDALPVRHLRLVLDHDHYALSQPAVVHAHADRETYVILKPYLGAHLLGRVHGIAASETPGRVRLTSEPDIMSLMQRPEDFMGNMISQFARATDIDAGGRFEFRAVLPTHNANLLFQSAEQAARFGPTSLRPGQTREVVLYTRACGTVNATIADAGGAGIEHAEIKLQPTASKSIQARAFGTRSASTDSAGTCTVGGLLPGIYLAHVSAPGFVGTDREIEVHGGKSTELAATLAVGGVVRGTVVDQDDQPVADAGVAYMQSMKVPIIGDLTELTGKDLMADAARKSRIRTDAEGRFTLSGIADQEPFSVAAWHRDFTGSLTQDVRVGDPDVVIRIGRPAKIRGVVLDDATGEPVPSFTVQTLVRMAMVMERPTSSIDVEQAEGGHFELSRIPAGKPTLRIRAQGYADLRRAVEVSAGAEVDLGELRLRQATVVRGLVVDADGTPVAGATVARHTPGLMNNPVLRSLAGASTGTSDARGRFELTGLPAGANKLQATATGHASGTSKRLKLAPGQVVDGVEIALSAGGTVRGELVLSAGMSPVGWLILLGNQQGGSMGSTYAAADGSFEFRHLDPGRYDVQAMLEERMNSLQSSKMNMMRPGQKLDIAGLMRTAQESLISTRCRVKAGEVTEVELDGTDFGEDGVEVTLQITLGKQPMPAGWLEIERVDTGELTQGFVEAGVGKLPAMQPGKIRVQVRTGLSMTPVGDPVTLDIPKGARHTAKLRLPGGSVRGRVVDQETGEPLHQAVVRIVSARGSETDQVEEIGFATTDADGAFRFVGLSEGRYSLRANDAFFAATEQNSSGRADNILVKAEVEREVVLRTRRAARASILVSGPSGGAVSQARVYAVDPSGKPLSILPARTDASGQATAMGLPAGDVRLVVLAPGLVPGFSAVRELVPNRETRYRIGLERGPKVRIRVESAGGEPLANARLSARWNRGPWIPVSLIQRFDPRTQRLDVGHLPAGRVEFRVHHAGSAPFVVTRDLPAGPSADLVFTAPK